MISCCYKCEDRHEGCHGKCDKYIKESKEHEIEKEKRRRDKILNNLAVQLYNTRTSHKNKSATKGKSHKK